MSCLAIKLRRGGGSFSMVVAAQRVPGHQSAGEKWSVIAPGTIWGSFWFGFFSLVLDSLGFFGGCFFLFLPTY